MNAVHSASFPFLQNGGTPLQQAAFMGHIDVVCFLIENGGNVFHQDDVSALIWLLSICCNELIYFLLYSHLCMMHGTSSLHANT